MAINNLPEYTGLLPSRQDPNSFPSRGEAALNYMLITFPPAMNAAIGQINATSAAVTASASAASTSEANAAASASAATEARDLAIANASGTVVTGSAKDWASAPEDVEVIPGYKSSMHWALKAAAAVAVLPPGTINDGVVAPDKTWSSQKIMDEVALDYSEASDPTYNTNPAKDNVFWLNVTTGELWICRDNTVNANVWVNQKTGKMITPANFIAVAGGIGSRGFQVLWRDVASVEDIGRHEFDDSLGAVNFIALSHNKQYLVCDVTGPTSQSSLAVYKLINGQFRLLMPLGAGVLYRGTNLPVQGDIAWSHDDVYLAIGVVNSSSEYVFIYKRAGDTFSKVYNSGVWTYATVTSLAWSPDGVYLAVGNNTTSPFLRIYKKDAGDGFTKLADPSTTPGNGPVTGISWSPDGTYLVAFAPWSPYIFIYKRSGDTFTKLANPSTLPSDMGTIPYYSAWSPDGIYLAVVTFSPTLRIYKRSGDTFTALTSIDYLPNSGTSTDVTWSPDGTSLYVANGTKLFIYTRSGDVFTKAGEHLCCPYGTKKISVA